MTTSTDVLALVRTYAVDQKFDADLAERVLTNISDEKSIPLRIIGGDMNFGGEKRLVLDPLALSIKNVMGVRARMIEFKPGTTVIYGGNGTGKTTNQRALLFAIGGAPAAGVKCAEDLMTHGAEEMEVRLEFFSGHIERGCSRRVVRRGKDAGTVKVEHWLKCSIAGDKADKPKEAQALIDGWLGVDAGFVRRVSCLEQGSITEILDEQPARRRELFYRLLTLDPAEQTRKSLAAALQEQEDFAFRQRQNAETGAAEVEALKRKLAQYPVAMLREKRETVSAQAAGAVTAPGETARLREVMQRTMVNFASAKRVSAERAKYRAKLDELRRDPSLTHVDTDIQKSLDIAEHAHNRAMQTSAAERATLAGLTNKGTQVKALPPVCPTCAIIGKTCDLGQDEKDKMLADIRVEWIKSSKHLAVLEATQHEYKIRLDQLREDLAAAHRATAQRKHVTEQIALLEQALDAMPVEVDAAGIERDLATYGAQLKQLEQAGTSQAADDLRLIDQALAEAASITAQIEALEKKAAAAASATQMPPADMDALRWIVKAFAKDGLPLWLARQHVSRVNTIAAELSGVDRYKYAFGPDLEIEFIDGASTIGPQLASGAARQRGAVVLMAALGRYLQELSGLTIPFLWIDELPFQDEANVELVIEMVKKLTQWYPKVILCASRWDEFVGKFDNEIALLPEQISAELDRHREVSAKLKAEGQAVLAPPAEVKTYPAAPAQSPADSALDAAQRILDDVAEPAQAVVRAAPEPAAEQTTMDADLEGCPF